MAMMSTWRICWASILCLLLTAHLTSTQIYEGDCELDLVFLVDGSFSMGEQNFRTLLSTIHTYISNLPVAEKAVQVGIVSFSTVVSGVSLTGDIDVLIDRMNTIFYQGRFSRTDRAFQEALGMFQYSQRPTVPKVVILFTDGPADYRARAVQEARALRDFGVTIWAVGIGNQAPIQDLYDYAGTVDKVALTRSFTSIPSVIDLPLICEVIYPPTPMVVTSAFDRTSSATTGFSSNVNTNEGSSSVSAGTQTQIQPTAVSNSVHTDTTNSQSQQDHSHTVTDHMSHTDSSSRQDHSHIVTDHMSHTDSSSHQDHSHTATDYMTDHASITPTTTTDQMSHTDSSSYQDHSHTVTDHMSHTDSSSRQDHSHIVTDHMSHTDSSSHQDHSYTATDHMTDHASITPTTTTDHMSHTYSTTNSNSHLDHSHTATDHMTHHYTSPDIGHTETLRPSATPSLPVTDTTGNTWYQSSSQIMTVVSSIYATSVTPEPSSSTTPDPDGTYEDLLCSKSKEVDGMWLTSHPTDCDKFIQCHYLGDSRLTTAIRLCPRGLFWSELKASCVGSHEANCSMDPCGNRELGSYSMDGGCGLFWRCNNYGVSQGESCMDGFAYTAREGCTVSPRCKTVSLAGDECATKGFCEHTPEPDNRSYKTKLKTVPGEWVTTRCLYGAKFDIASCSCVASQPFTSDCEHIKEIKWHSNESNQTTSYGGNDESVSIVVDPASTRPIALRFRYKPSHSNDSNTTLGEVLLRSSQCPVGGLFVLWEYDHYLEARMFAKNGYMLKASLPLVGVDDMNWRTVRVRYTSWGDLSLKLTSRHLSFTTYVEGGLYVPMSLCGWDAGLPGSLAGQVSPFSGEMEEIYVSRCYDHGF